MDTVYVNSLLCFICSIWNPIGENSRDMEDPVVWLSFFRENVTESSWNLDVFESHARRPCQSRPKKP